MNDATATADIATAPGNNDGTDPHVNHPSELVVDRNIDHNPTLGYNIYPDGSIVNADTAHETTRDSDRTGVTNNGDDGDDDVASTGVDVGNTGVTDELDHVIADDANTTGVMNDDDVDSNILPENRGQ